MLRCKISKTLLSSVNLEREFKALSILLGLPTRHTQWADLEITSCLQDLMLWCQRIEKQSLLTVEEWDTIKPFRVTRCWSTQEEEESITSNKDQQLAESSNKWCIHLLEWWTKAAFLHLAHKTSRTKLIPTHCSITSSRLLLKSRLELEEKQKSRLWRDRCRHNRSLIIQTTVSF